MKLKKLAASLLAAAMLFCGTATTAFADGRCDGGWGDDLDDILEEIDIDIPDIDIDVEKTWKRGEAEGEIQLPNPGDVNVKVKYGKDEWVSVDVEWDDEDEDEDEDNFATVIPEDADSVTWKGEIDLEDIIEAIIADIIPSGGKAIQANGGFGWGDNLKKELKTILQTVITELTKSGTNIFDEDITGNDAAQWRLASKTFKLLDGWKLDPTLKLTNTYTGDNGDGGDEEEEDTVSITVNKVWEGDENYPNARPEKITVRLLADNKVVEGKTLTLSSANSWMGTFLELKKYQTDENNNVKVDEHNQPIVIKYTVEEEVPDGYEAEVTDSVKNGFTITNTYKGGDEEYPDTVNVSFTKEFKVIDGYTIPAGANFTFTFTLTPVSPTTGEVTGEARNKTITYNGSSRTTQVTFENVPAGTYTLTESYDGNWGTSIPNGVKVFVTKEGVTFGDNHENTLVVTNTYNGDGYGDEEEENPVSFQKYFKLINATADDVKGHKFTFTLTPWRVELREAGEENIIKSKTVYYNANGVMVTFENVPAGHYILEEILPEGVDGWETSIPDGVMVYIDEEGTITLPTDDSAENEFSVTNTYKKTDSTPIDSDDEEEEEKDESDLTVKKVDNETGKLITEKATFRIYKLSGSRKLYYTGSSWSSNVEKAKEYSTKNGKFTAYDLGAGTYYVEEVKAPSGYNLADDLKVKLTSKDKTVEFANSKAKQNPNTGALVLPLDLADAAVAAMTLGAAAWVISKSKK